MELYRIKCIKKYLPDYIRKITETKRIKILNLGSTAAKKDYVFEDDSIVNAAMVPQSLSYDVKILKYYSKYMQKGSIVNCNLMPCSFLVDEYSDWNTHLKYCYVLPHNDVLMFSNKMLLKAIIKPIYRHFFHKDEAIEQISLEEHALARTNGWNVEFGIECITDVFSGIKFQDIIQKNIDRILEMSEFCKKNQYKFVITMLPVSNELKKYIPANYYSKMIFQSIEKIDNFMVLDYYHDNCWCENELYDGCDSLNELSAKLFTEDFVGRISNS